MDTIPEGFRKQMGKGRPKGATNKTTKLAKQAIAEAFDRLGGTDALVAWAQGDDDNLRVFYSTIWPKIIPLQVTGEDGGPVQFEQVVNDADAVTSAIASLAERARAARVASSTQH